MFHELIIKTVSNIHVQLSKLYVEITINRYIINSPSIVVKEMRAVHEASIRIALTL